MTERVLCVDDDQNVLRGYQRHLRKRYALEVTSDPRVALRMIEQQGPFAVVVSDMRMPEMDGVQFLTQVRAVAPDTVRMMLTGNADQGTAVDAVNEGCIFRFLSKPCPPEDLAKAIDLGLAQYRLIRSEKELLSNTLTGSVKLLTEILALVNPTAFGRGQAIRQTAHRLCRHLPVANAWEIELAAMLSQVGCIAVPPAILRKAAEGEALSEEEDRVLRGHPRLGSELIARIPRLEGVARIVARQHDPPGLGSEDRAATPYGVQVLQAALELDRLQNRLGSADAVLSALVDSPNRYDEQIVIALAELLGTDYVVRALAVADLEDGMVFDEHATTRTGTLLIAKGHSVDPLTRKRLAAVADSLEGVRQPIRMRCPVSISETATASNR